MPRRASQHPTEAELEILNVLWSRGPSKVSEVHETLQADRNTTLTTTLKLLQVMTKKGLTIREHNSRPHRYRPTKPEEKTKAGLLNDLANRAFDGSVRKLLIRAVQDSKLDRDELGEIRKLIDVLRRDKQKEK